MTTDNLPPLPEPEIWCQEHYGLGDVSTTIGYSGKQMHEYARAAIAASAQQSPTSVAQKLNLAADHAGSFPRDLMVVPLDEASRAITRKD